MRSLIWLNALSLMLASPPLGPEQPVNEDALRKPLAGILFEGNTIVHGDEMLKVVLSRDGLLTTATQIENDTKALIATRRFFSVKPVIRQASDGPVLVFKVTERP